MPSGYALVEFAGSDALAFLQAQLATDLRDSSDLSWRWAALCSVKGRALATGALLRLSTERWLWLIRADLATPLSEHLRRYLLRSKVQIRVLAGIRIDAEYSPVAPDSDQQLQRIRSDDQGGWILDNLPIGWRVRLAVDESHGEFEAMGLVDWENARIEHGMVMINANSSDLYLSHALELHRLRAVSVRKGCYPGQEIIARTHYLGRNKRALAVLRPGRNRIAAGDSIKAEAGTIGTVVEVVSSGLALAEINAQGFESGHWQCAGEKLCWDYPKLPPAAATQASGNT